LLSETNKNAVKSKGRGTCYSTVYTTETQAQQQFTISEVAAD